MDGFLLSLYAAAGGFTTSNRLSPGRRSQDFDPCSLCGERRTRGGKGIIKDTFQFTLSLRRATVLLSSPPVMWQRFQSTLSLRRATGGYPCRCPDPAISIHALLTESDQPKQYNLFKEAIFQSTLSSRRATNSWSLFSYSITISIHALLTESDMHRVRTQWRIPISIHALLTESDVAALRLCGSARCISIHALLAESDQIAREIATKARDFNPRSPCGERPLSPVPLRGSRNFNPRSPCGERPLSGGTTASRGNFNPRSPCGERLGFPRHRAREQKISIHALLAESDHSKTGAYHLR